MDHYHDMKLSMDYHKEGRILGLLRDRINLEKTHPYFQLREIHISKGIIQNMKSGNTMTSLIVGKYCKIQEN